MEQTAFALSIALNLAFGLVVIIHSFRTQNLIPQDAVLKLLEQAGAAAKTTPTNVDDIAVEIAKELATLLQPTPSVG